MSDRERRVTFMLDADAFRQLEALATLTAVPIEEIAKTSVSFHVQQCMKQIRVPGQIFNHFAEPAPEEPEKDSSK